MPHSHTKDWIDILAALAPLFAVLVAVGIGAVQLYLQHRQLNQDLLETVHDLHGYARVLERLSELTSE